MRERDFLIHQESFIVVGQLINICPNKRLKLNTIVISSSGPQTSTSRGLSKSGDTGEG